MKGTEELRAYWREQLSAVPPLPTLPCDKERPPVSSFLREHVTSPIDSRVWLGIEALATKTAVTPQDILLAALNLLLFRYTGQTDLLVGAILSSNETASEALVPLRTRIGTGATVRDLVMQIVLEIKGATEHLGLSLASLSQLAGHGESAHQPTLFNTAFVFGRIVSGNSSPESAATPNGCEYFANCALVFHVSETPNGLSLDCEYDAELFEQGTPTRLLQHFETLLRGIAANPDTSVERLALVNGTELHQLLVEWNATRTDFPEDACIHQLFEQQAERTPHAVATVCGDRRLSYRELNERANQLAHYLRGLNVGPDLLVGICVERSVEMLVGLLGILKAGGAYLPLDPTYPAERIAFMIQEAGVKVILTQDRLVPSLTREARAVRLDSDWPAIGAESKQNPAAKVASNNLAYVIYTSGSTGKPKGVMIEHRNVVNFFSGMDARIQHNGKSTWLAVTSLSFDISVLELFWTLARGFRVIISSAGAGDRATRQNGQYIPDGLSIPALIELHKVTHLQCTPSMVRMLLLDDRMREALGHLQSLLIGGEGFPPALAAQLRKFFKADIINMYGPTETTVWSSTYPLPSNPCRVPVGRPIANTQMYVLDRDLQPVPVGIAGELLIGGTGVARGYLNCPKLTAERFIPNPFNGNGADRLYRTGDLARYLPDGNIELLGRMDQQVKIQGHRIELGEIEALLNGNLSVRESVVVAREGPEGEKRLFAYVIPREDTKALAGELRRYLKHKLPDHMVPAQVILMSAFPQTPNRKIDRNALPSPEQLAPELETHHEAGLSPIEEALTDLWCEMLQVRKVHRDDDFFELGGNSLSAVQLLSRIRQTCEIDLPLESLFYCRTVAGLAGKLEELFLAQAEATKSTSRPVAREGGATSRLQTARPSPAIGSKDSEASRTPIGDRPSRMGPRNEFEPPATLVEEVVAAIWVELLRVERVGRTDNFFDLGGNSLSATQLVSRLRQVFQVNLPLASVFEAPTLEATSALLVANEPRPGLVEKAATLLMQIEGMSEEAVRRNLDENEVAEHACESLQEPEPFQKECNQKELTMRKTRVRHPDLFKVAKTLHPLPFPTRFAVELCADCNLACSMCHHPSMRRPKGKMPFELWKRCADEIAAVSPETQCWFSFCGEPLLEPDLLLKMLEYGKSAGLKSLNINSNGMLLTDKVGQRILDSGVDLVVFGVDGFSRATYEKIRVRGRRDVVYANVERLLSRRQARQNGPEIQVQFIEMEENEHELEAFKEHWLKRGATLKIRNKLSWGGRFDTPLEVPESERIPCPWAITMMHVFWDGRVPRCPGDTEGDEFAGNAWDESLVALWDRLGGDRTKHLDYRFKDLPERCQQCKDWMTGAAERISPENFAA